MRAAVGLTDQQNRAIELRLRWVANAVGIPLAMVGCRPNVLLIAVDNKEDFIRALRRRYPSYFSNSFGQTIPVPREKGPAVAWHIGGLMIADHLQPVSSTRGVLGVTSTDASRLRSAELPHFLGGVLVIERKALAGLTTLQIADYSALRLYATTDPTTLKPTADTILRAFEASSASSVPPSMPTGTLRFSLGCTTWTTVTSQITSEVRSGARYASRTVRALD